MSTDKECSIYIYNGTLFRHKEENLATCNNMDGSWGQFAKWNNSDRKINTIWSHFYVESKQTKTELIDREQTGGCQGWGVDKMGEGCQKVQTSCYKINKLWGCNVQHSDYSQ